MCSTQCTNVCSKMCHPKTTQINKGDRGFKMAPAQSFDRGLLKSRMCGSVRNKAQEEALSISHPSITAFYLPMRNDCVPISVRCKSRSDYCCKCAAHSYDAVFGIGILKISGKINLYHQISDQTLTINNTDTSNQNKRLQMTHGYQPGLWIM